MARYTPESKDKVRDAADFYALVSEVGRGVGNGIER